MQLTRSLLPALGVSIALASLTPVDALAGDRPWPEVERRARNTYTAGAIVYGSGVGLSLIGIAIVDGGIEGAGGLAALTGTGIMAGSSLRWRRALVEQGADVSPVAGYATWGLWGTSLAVRFGSALNGEYTPAGALLALGTQLGAVICGIIQGVQNSKAAKDLAVLHGPGGTSAWVAPTMTPDQIGVAVVVVW